MADNTYDTNFFAFVRNSVLSSRIENDDVEYDEDSETDLSSDESNDETAETERQVDRATREDDIEKVDPAYESQSYVNWGSQHEWSGTTQDLHPLRVCNNTAQDNSSSSGELDQSYAETLTIDTILPTFCDPITLSPAPIEEPQYTMADLEVQTIQDLPSCPLPTEADNPVEWPVFPSPTRQTMERVCPLSPSQPQLVRTFDEFNEDLPSGEEPSIKRRRTSAWDGETGDGTSCSFGNVGNADNEQVWEWQEGPLWEQYPWDQAFRLDRFDPMLPGDFAPTQPGYHLPPGGYIEPFHGEIPLNRYVFDREFVPDAEGNAELVFEGPTLEGIGLARRAAPLDLTDEFDSSDEDEGEENEVEEPLDELVELESVYSCV